MGRFTKRSFQKIYWLETQITGHLLKLHQRKTICPYQLHFVEQNPMLASHYKYILTDPQYLQYVDCVLYTLCRHLLTSHLCY